MFAAENIKQIVLDYLTGTEIFLVEVKVSKGNKISVFIDRPTGLLIDDCVSLSKFLEEKLDRETNDFEMEVSSPGLDAPFKVKEQFVKAIGRTIQVLTLESKKIEGTLKRVEEGAIVIEPIKLKKAKLAAENEEVTLPLNQIKTTKELLIIK